MIVLDQEEVPVERAGDLPLHVELPQIVKGVRLAATDRRDGGPGGSPGILLHEAKRPSVIRIFGSWGKFHVELSSCLVYMLGVAVFRVAKGQGVVTMEKPKEKEVVNAMAEILMFNSSENGGDPQGSVLAGATLNLEATARLQEQGFVLRLSDGSEFEVRVAQVH